MMYQDKCEDVTHMFCTL